MAFRDEGLTAFGPVLVAGTDDLDGRDQSPCMALIVNPDFVLGRRKFIGFEQQRRRLGLPGRARVGVRVVSPIAGILRFEGGHVDFDQIAHVDFDAAAIFGGQNGVQPHGHDSRPETVEFFPRSQVSHGWSKVIA